MEEYRLFPIEEGAAYLLPNLRDFYKTENFALVCVTEPAPFSSEPFAVGSVGLRDNNYQSHTETPGYDSDNDYTVENRAPYALAGSTSGSFGMTNFTLGINWSVTCQAFCGPNLTGEASVAVTRTFQMIDETLLLLA